MKTNCHFIFFINSYVSISTSKNSLSHLDLTKILKKFETNIRFMGWEFPCKAEFPCNPWDKEGFINTLVNFMIFWLPWAAIQGVLWFLIEMWSVTSLSHARHDIVITKLNVNFKLDCILLGLCFFHHVSTHWLSLSLNKAVVFKSFYFRTKTLFQCVSISG